MGNLCNPTHFTMLCALGAFGLVNGSAWAQQEHGHGDFCDPEAVTPEPVLQVGDFDGDGTVTEEDVRRVERQVQSGEYIAFFDRNADHALDQKDIELTTSEMGTSSRRLDQQLAQAFQGTSKYRDKDVAIADRYIPFTERSYGHGVHWAQHPKDGGFDYAFEPGNPVGLNYDNDRLWAVFYYVGASLQRLDGTRYPPGDEFRPFSEAPEGFAGDKDKWHFHAGACFNGLDYRDPVMDPSKLSFREGLSPKECLPYIEEGRITAEKTHWNPKFHMIHAWLYELNPCGTFAGTHPRLAEGAMHPDDSMPHGKIDTLDPHPEYQFAGGTLCYWLSQVDREPDFCDERQAQQ